MEVPISQFRRNIFSIVEEALEGKEVLVSHKGRRVRIVPEHAPSKLSNITVLNILNPPDLDLLDTKLKKKMLDEMQKGWAKDWEKL
jgi:prevent-host-death family protein